MTAIANSTEGAAPVDLGVRHISNRERFLQAFRQNRIAQVGLLIVILMAISAILAPAIAPYDPIAPDYTAVLSPPSAAHWLGTDELGRDILTRLLYGARISLVIGFVGEGVSFAGPGPGLDLRLVRRLDRRSDHAHRRRVLRHPGADVPDRDRLDRDAGAGDDLPGPGVHQLAERTAHDAQPGHDNQEHGLRHGGPFDRGLHPAHAAPARPAQRHRADDRAGHPGHRRDDPVGSDPELPGPGIQIPTPSWGTMVNTGQNYIFNAQWYAIFPAWRS
jgi:hypothetical protein